MVLSLAPIYLIDFISNTALMGLSVYLISEVSKIRRLRPHVPLWMYLHWQVIALGVFALSHSIGHIVQRLLIISGHEDLWSKISPFTGGTNSLTFVVVTILSFLYKDLETASERYGTLKEAKQELEIYIEKLKQSSIQMEKDAEEIYRKNKELTAINRIAMAVGKSLEMEKILPVIVKEVQSFLGVEFLAIYLVERNRLVMRISEGLSEDFREKASVRSLEEPWLKREVMAGRPFFASERTEEHSGRIDDAIKLMGVQSWAAVPLMAKGSVGGVLAVGSSSDDGLEERQMGTLMTVGGYIGVVVENAMLYEELKQRLEDLERFRKFSVGREKRIIELKERLKETEGA